MAGVERARGLVCAIYGILMRRSPRPRIPTPPPRHPGLGNSLLALTEILRGKKQLSVASALRDPLPSCGPRTALPSGQAGGRRPLPPQPLPGPGPRPSPRPAPPRALAAHPEPRCSPCTAAAAARLPGPGGSLSLSFSPPAPPSMTARGPSRTDSGSRATRVSFRVRAARAAAHVLPAARGARGDSPAAPPAPSPPASRCVCGRKGPPGGREDREVSKRPWRARVLASAVLNTGRRSSH
ncbi:translation initiation factor IF-2-like [Herpailurus yagouaroundi]|uniref:translation initiation factor IF-2-like n=1 Tax=Herpailurus yagouaroundi TaxID=1608482 RepID=UPI001AD6E8A4|nr:translation initiation factor IF-2-like [Puma yagouaroundi]